MKIKWYWLFKQVVIGPFLRLYNRPEVRGVENVPAEGGAIMASNHQTVMDSFFLPLLIPRRVTFLAKQEYFTGRGIVGKLQRAFFLSVGQVPIDRSSGNAARSAIETGIKLVREGKILGIYPEGTRSPDGRIYRGKTGVARMALATGAPVIPVAMFGTRRANPIGTWIPRPAKVGMHIGSPIDPMEFITSRGLDKNSYEAARALTDRIIEVLVEMTGNEYVDCYAADVKQSLAAGHGYPEGIEPVYNRVR
ncbi:1-acyl-sn-glycerol-3-phosphate acyltransferase [Corynebacterium sp. CCM 8835]|uniref:1-acyl-sn-glycerol-3-phosphate acyltransferase n=1 Tax=Corynebacterium antarcticum TaxID=2800405 RepID=A0A9Q4GJX8_9CORY|nr:lysophospholipid acyltransferase family protein [Corynebacterium antarcticum]MCK7641823.1 1-acyl-sn-glycerol-3-phosphate acyltransferase [Corynebacterium antarcticum]MCK7660080.1 1-acyl-sn-glycerol-3-phosphate acyltransferase [Corynebacterium antarcticum]MCL0245052.1 1-acyl-sn-glycerol-3-phosphate acyltransferase [Corynebacterium antarcticum]MCX7491426.1 lysophospholipid acyltransferase family protein [Corynebacterium antarcticum]MCX7537445.1 lysophospholipid acyltransferase family protein 